MMLFNLTACEQPTDVYVFQVPSCQPDKSVLNLKIPKCRVKVKPGATLACNESYSQFETRYNETSFSFMMNSVQSERCEIIIAINYPKSGISGQTKRLYFDAVSTAVRTCLDDQSLVLNAQYRVEDEASYNALCDR